jgi:hypothetical protein
MKELAQFIFYRTHHFSIFIDPLISRQFIEQWDFLEPFPQDCIRYLRSLLWEFHSDLNNEAFQLHAEVTIALAKAVKSLREHACLSKLTLVLGFGLFKGPTSISALRDQTMPIKRIVETIGPQLGELKDFFHSHQVSASS